MKISVLTPSFNSGKYIERAIQSVLAQNNSSFEHIIFDATSTDNTLTILKKYAHIKWVSEPDKGQADAMNKAFSLSSGDIIVYLNADDEFAPEAFATILDAFAKFPDTDMVVGNLVYSDPGGTKTRVPSKKYRDIIQYWLNLFPNNPVSYFYKRTVQQQVGPFPIGDHLTMDIWFLLHVYQSFKITRVNTVLGTFHSDGTNKTAVTDPGVHLHNTIKTHLKQQGLVLYLFFYYKFLLGRVHKLFS